MLVGASSSSSPGSMLGSLSGGRRGAHLHNRGGGNSHHGAGLERQELGRAVRDLELLVAEVEGGGQPLSPHADHIPDRASSSRPPRSPGPAASHHNSHAAAPPSASQGSSGSQPAVYLPIGRVPAGACLCLSSVLLYARITDLSPYLSWLLPLLPLWMVGIAVLFRSFIPDMLSTTEKALGAQRDRDSRQIASARQRLSLREWDEQDQADREAECGMCFQCGLWTDAVRGTLSALSLAMGLGFLMMVSLQLEIRFLPHSRIWEVSVPLVAAQIFAVLASAVSAGSRDSPQRRCWLWVGIFAAALLLTTPSVLSNVARMPHPPDLRLPPMDGIDTSPRGPAGNITKAPGAGSAPSEAEARSPLDAGRVIAETAAEASAQASSSSSSSSSSSWTSGEGGNGEGAEQGEVAAGAWAAALSPLLSALVIHLATLRGPAAGGAIGGRERRGITGYEMAPLGGDALPQPPSFGGAGARAGWAWLAVNVMAVSCVASLCGYLELGTPALLQGCFASSFLAGAVWALYGENPPVEPQGQARGAGGGQWELVPEGVREALREGMRGEVDYLVSVGLDLEEAQMQVQERMARHVLHPRRAASPSASHPIAAEWGTPHQPHAEWVVGSVEDGRWAAAGDGEEAWVQGEVRGGGGGKEVALERRASEPEAPSVRAMLEDLGVALPTEFLCPITMEVMMDPVILTDGHVYERVSIERWLISHNTSPKTNQAINRGQLIPCHALRSIIQEFVAKHALPDDVVVDVSSAAVE